MQTRNYWVTPQREHTTVNPKDVIEKVCKHFNIKVESLNNKVRFRNYVEARSIIGYILTKETPLVLREVGELLERDHSSVIHYNKKVSGFMDVDQKYKELVNSFI